MDLASLRSRWTIGACLFGLLLLGGWIWAADSAARKAHANREETRGLTIAKSAALAIDGDLLGLGIDEKAEGWTKLKEFVRELAFYQSVDGGLTVIAVGRGGGAPSIVAASHTDAAFNAAEVTPEVAALLAGDLASHVSVSNGRFRAYAPVDDSFGGVGGLVRVEGEHTQPLIERSLVIAGHSFVGVLVLLLIAKLTAIAMGLHCDALRKIAEGHPDEVGVRFASREMRDLAQSVERLAAGRASAPAAPLVTTRTVVPTQEPEMSIDHDAPSFSPRDLVDTVVRGALGRARSRGDEVQVTLGAKVPEEVSANARLVAGALEHLVAHSVRSTEGGMVRLRVARVPDTRHLRFEVLDTGRGIPMAVQTRLREELEHPNGKAGLEGPLHRAAACARQLGTTLEFESQVGQGSRFGFVLRDVC